jgi:catenin alpha
LGQNKSALTVYYPFQQKQKIIMDPLNYDECGTRPSLEEQLESIISGAALMSDSSCTRNERRERIMQQCNNVRQALQDLLSEYMNNVSLWLHYFYYYT